MRRLAWFLFAAALLLGHVGAAQAQLTGTPDSRMRAGQVARVLHGAPVTAAQMPALTGDCTSSAGTVATACTKTSGVAFGTAATANTGTSGATVPLLNGSNTFSGPLNLTSSTAPVNGPYLPGTNTLGLATNSTLGLVQDASQRLLTGTVTAVTTYGNSNAHVVPWQFNAVRTTTTQAAMALTDWAASNGATSLILAKSQGGAIGTQGAVTTGQNVGSVIFQADDSAKFQIIAQISAQATGTISAGVVPGNLNFQTANASGVLGVVLTLDTAGHIWPSAVQNLTCGTGCSGTPSGNDTFFQMTSGTGVTSVTANFSTTWLAGAPGCVASLATSLAVSSSIVASSTAVTVSFTAPVTSAIINVLCVQ